jgi:hypothetical protein
MRFILWLCWLPVRLIKALAWWYVVCLIALGFMFGLVTILAPLGDFGIALGALFIVFLPELIAGWRRHPAETQSPASESESEGQALALPVAPAAGHALGVREVYRGSLTTLPRE